MIRVIILLIFLFLVWVLYASGFERLRKIRICIIALVVSAIGFWFDGYYKRELDNLVDVSQVQVCGVSSEFSYRTNYNLTICVQNDASGATVSRLKVAAIASNCAAQSCVEVQRVERDMLVNIAPLSRVQLEQNLSFTNVSPDQSNIQWSVEVLEVKASRAKQGASNQSASKSSE
ncbi:MAG: hypothetical protein ACJAQ6_000779 [Arenicella sp.]|jgi:hypothetical protein